MVKALQIASGASPWNSYRPDLESGLFQKVFPLKIVHSNLVGAFNPSEKYESQLG